jgi:P-type Cu+ transporter
MGCFASIIQVALLLTLNRDCPEKVLQSLLSLDPTIETQPGFSTTTPLLKLTYTPRLPDITIRSIFSTITSLNHAYRVTLVQEATVEERAEVLRRKEQIALSKRLKMAFVFSIPTFIFGVLFMSLIPSQSSVRRFFNEPMWAGRVSRNTWILFFLATPVEFFVADIFHRKALQEIKALWWPGSRTPIYQRFFKFGSMNLLVITYPYRV